MSISLQNIFSSAMLVRFWYSNITLKCKVYKENNYLRDESGACINERLLAEKQSIVLFNKFGKIKG